MLRNTILAFAAAVALGTIFLATEASAGGFGRLQNDPDVATDPIVDGRYGCWTWSYVLTPRGWTWRRVNACYFRYD
jgi:hypothetical protein